MIPNGVTAEHILTAMSRIDDEGVPPGRDSRTHEVRHDGRAYPPKFLVSRACEVAFGRSLPSRSFTGGPEVNGFLRRRGFTVVPKTPQGGREMVDRQRSSAERSPDVLGSVADAAASPVLRDYLLSVAPVWTWAELGGDRGRPPAASGVYAWFFKVVPKTVPTTDCFVRDGRAVLYVGISPGKPNSKETLRSRLRFHYNGHAEGSTLRLTLGCLLEEELGTVLCSSGKRMMFGAAEARLSQWMAANTAVTWVEYDQPHVLERHLLETMQLPLNIDHNSSHPFCDTLRSVRRAARLRARRLPNLKDS